MASVPMPQPAPQPKEGEAPPEQPKSIAGLLGNLFGGSQAEAKPAAPAASQTVALRGSNTEMAAKPKRSAPVRTAAAPTQPHAKPHDAARQAEGGGERTRAPSTGAAVAASPKAESRPRRKCAPPIRRRRRQSNNGLLQGAQPVVPAGSFESRWTALR